MKNLLFVLFLAAFSSTFAQNGKYVDAYLTVLTKAKKTVPFTDFKVLEIETNEIISATTDTLGKATISVLAGKSYAVSFADFENIKKFSVPAENKNGIAQTIIYEGINAGKKLKDIKPDTIKQEIKPGQKATRTETVRIFQTVTMENKFLPNIRVWIYSKATNKVYYGKSNADAIVRFLVPPGKYFVSVEEVKNYQEFEIQYDKGPFLTQFLYYEKADIKEFETNDTITQKLSRHQDATSDRSLLRVTIRNPKYEPLMNEPVWVNQVGTTKVYYGETDDLGRVKFLLKKGEHYLVHLKYERSVSLIDFEMTGDFFSTDLNIEYLGSKTIEEHWANSQRTKEGYLKEFMSVDIQDAKWDENYYQKTDYGFDLTFNVKTPNYAPAVFDNNLFVSSGYYTPNIYSINAKNGQFHWGVKFKENGASPAVFADSVILVNTESCTLYALHAYSGKLLWSKWLSPFVHSSPSVANGKVYATYPGKLFTYDAVKSANNQFIAVAFDLKTGNVVWQNSIDCEVLAAPVIADSCVYFTTLSGMLYQFNERTGKLLNAAKIRALTPPTIVDGFAYIAIASKTLKQKQEIVQLKTTDLSISKKYPSLTGFQNFNSDQPNSLGTFELMSYSGPQLSVYQDKFYTVLGGKLICFDPNKGNLLWSNYLDVDAAYKPQAGSAPIFLKDKLILSTKKGKIKVLDPSNGKLIKEYSLNAEPIAEPTVYDGWIYTGTKEGKVISINAKDKTLTGEWLQWNGNGSHNRKFNY
jgi:outer membrane protein assembly factor BamB